MNKYTEIDISEKTEVWEKWWNGDLGRPLFYAVTQADDCAVPAKIPCYSAETPAETIFLEHKKYLESLRFLADGYPMVWMDFGPGALAAMVGGSGAAEGTDTVWFGPGDFAGKPLEEFSIKFNPSSEWAARTTECIRASHEILGKDVVIGMPDIGGVLDVIASLRDSENLLMDLYDDPDTLKRLVSEEGLAFRDSYDYFDDMIKKFQGVRSCWGGLLSKGSNYMLQSDFSYMISPEMFEEFVYPELINQCEFITRPCYHLDGIGQIPHIQHLAKIPNLQCIQWVPGAGMPEQSEWPEVLRQIEDAGIKLQLLGSLKSIGKSLKLLKNPANAHAIMYISQEELPEAQALLAEYGVG